MLLSKTVDSFQERLNSNVQSTMSRMARELIWNKLSNHRRPKPGICTISINCPFMTRCQKKSQDQYCLLILKWSRLHFVRHNVSETLASAQRVEIVWSNISNTTRTVSSNIQTREVGAQTYFCTQFGGHFYPRDDKAVIRRTTITSIVKTANKTRI